jgi:DNA-binding YbaB/EbfC family protein
MKNLGQMMKQAQQMQSKMAEIQQTLDAAEISGASGGGMVKATLNGKGELRRLRIDPTLVDRENVEMLEDLVVAAYTDAKAKVETYATEEMSKLTGGLELPEGFKLPF